MKKRFIRILLCLVLAISLVPAAALAAPTNYNVWVNGEQFTSEHLTIACGSGTASYDPAARSITLNGASITPGGPGPEGYGLYIEDDGSGQKTTVTLAGESSITAFGTFGIYSETELEVTGGGSFTMENVSNGIVSLKGVCVSGSGTQVVVRDGTNTGINALSGAVQVNGAKVTISAKMPIKAVEMTVSQGALLDVTHSGEGDYAVYIAKDATGAGSGNIRIADNSTVSVKSEKSGVLATGGITAAGGKLTVQANEFGVQAAETITIDGCETTVTSTNDLGITAVAGMNVTDATLNVTAAKGAIATRNLSMEGTEAVLDMTGEDGFAVSVLKDASGEGNVKLDHSDVTVTSKGGGISADGGIEGKGGKLKVDAAKSGLQAAETITLDGCETTVTSTNDLGITAVAGMNVTDATLNVTAAREAIATKNLSMESATAVLNMTGEDGFAVSVLKDVSGEGNVKLNHSDVTVTSKGNGILAEGGVEGKGGKLKVDAVKGGMYAVETIEIDGCETTVTSTNDYGITAEAEMNVKNAALTVAAKNLGIAAVAGMNVTDATLNVTASNGAGITTAAGMNVKNATLNVTAAREAIATRNLSMESATAVLDMTGEDGFAVSVLKDVSGEGNVKLNQSDVTVTSRNGGVFAEADVEVNGGKMDVNAAAEYGLFGAGSIKIDGAEMQINATDIPLLAYKDLNVCGGAKVKTSGATPMGTVPDGGVFKVFEAEIDAGIVNAAPGYEDAGALSVDPVIADGYELVYAKGYDKNGTEKDLPLTGTNGFSSYCRMHFITKESENKPVDSVVPKPEMPPKSGDTTKMMLWGLLLVTGCAAAAAVTAVGRKKKRAHR